MDTRRLQASTQYQQLCIVAIKLYFSSSSGNRFVLFMPAYYDLYIDIIRIVRVKLFQSFRHLFYNLFIYPLTVERKFVCKSRHYQYSIMKSKPYSMLHFQKKKLFYDRLFCEKYDHNYIDLYYAINKPDITIWKIWFISSLHLHNYLMGV